MSDFFMGWHLKYDEVTLREYGHNSLEFGG